MVLVCVFAHVFVCRIIQTLTAFLVALESTCATGKKYWQ